MYHRVSYFDDSAECSHVLMAESIFMAITVSIVEDDRGTRESLLAVLAGKSALQCLAAYATAEEALQKIPAQTPQVALVDINLPKMNGIELVSRLKAEMPDLHLLILTSYEESAQIFSALRAGASGYLLKKAIPEELVPAIEQVAAGGAPMSFQVARKVIGYFQQLESGTPPEAAISEMQKLTDREREILALLAEGYLIKEISDSLGIAFHTARTHLQHIYKKLHVQSRTGAVVKYLRDAAY
jgi:DNA-binding NarL/FixJ family response regulator